MATVEKLSALCSNDTLKEICDQIIASEKPWQANNFSFVRALKQSEKPEGVDLMRDETGALTAVKRATRATMSMYRNELSILRELTHRGFPYTVEVLDLFYDDTFSYASLSYASEGDLFTWCNSAPQQAPEREAAMRPLALQICSAVKWMHEAGISHRGITLEHVLLAPSALKGQLQVKVIGFGMSTTERFSIGDVRGKQSYKAPEVHLGCRYDNFLMDNFAIGVVMFAMATRDYPWNSTKRGSCAIFDSIRLQGLQAVMSKRRHRHLSGVSLSQYISQPLMALLEQLLSIDPNARLSLGERAGEDFGTNHSSVWDMPWASDSGSLLSEESEWRNIVAL